MGKGCNHAESMAQARADAKLIIRLAAAARAAERRRIRRAIVPWLKTLRSCAESLCESGHGLSLGHQDAAIKAIDAATRAPRKGRAR